MTAFKTAEYFWSKVAVSNPDACWLWQGTPSRLGYGKLAYQGKHWRAHRLAWTLVHGAIPPGLFVCHSCDTPLCCNPAHLWLGDSDANIADRIAKGRSAHGATHSSRTHPERIRHGSRHGRAKLTEEQVLAIRSAYAMGERVEALWPRYGVSRGLVSQIIHRRIWRHI